MAFCAMGDGIAAGVRVRAPCRAKCAARAPLHVRVANRGARQQRTAVLVHDFLTDGRLFSALVREPVLRDTQLVAVDLRGHGRSPRPDAPYTHAEDLRAIAATHASGAAHLVGAGLGGIHALETAIVAGSGAWVRSVALLASGLPGHAWRRESFLDITEAQRVVNEEEEGERAEVARWVRTFISANATWTEVLKKGGPEVVERLKDMVQEYSGYHFREMDLEIRPGGDESLRMRLGKVAVPVLAAVGERDTRDFKEIAQEILDGVAIPAGKEPLIVQGAGHFSSLENPPEVARMLAEFWNSLECNERKQKEKVSQISDNAD